MFGKKKKVIETQKSDVMEADNLPPEIPMEKPKKIELTAEQKKTVELMNEFVAKYEIFTPEDFSRIREGAMTCNLLFAIYAEVKELRKTIERMNEE